jgi:hypothetical protein
MDTIDELGRRAARTALAEAEAYTDVEAGLARILADEEDVDWNVDRGSRRGWVVVLAAAAAVVAAVTAGVVWSQDDPSPRLVPATPPEPSHAPTTPATPEPTTTAAPQPAEPSGLAVSYTDPPPPLQPVVFATVDAPSEFFFNAVVTDNGGVVVLDRATESALVVDPDGTSRPVPLDVMPSSLVAAGPGDVVYGLGPSEQQTDTRMLAIALSGERAGQVIASSPPFDVRSYLELPVGAIGHGPEGIIDRARRVGEQLMGYVDGAGRPVDIDWVPPPLLTIDENDTIRIADGAQEWPLDIERHPDAPTPLEGPSPPTPAAGGRAVYWAGIGPPDEPGTDFPNSTINVVAVLSPDGTGQWYRLPDGWSVAASDVWGTILTRRVGEQFELATLTPPGEAPPPPTTTTVPPVDRSSPLAALAQRIGASTAIAREPRKVTVFADGATIEAATPPDVYVQTDGTMLWWDIVTGGTTSRSAAATLDGTIVCEVEGTIHRVRQEADGGYVASVERRDEIAGIAEEIAVPNYAVDCDTGSIDPIEPVSWRWEVGTRRIERIGDRTFTHIYDAEGNGDVTNEDGISINGENYAGYHTFSADGARVVYGDMSASPSPHVTTVLRSRDTTTGELLWSTELDRPVDLTYWYGDRIIARAPADGVPGAAGEAVIVLDAVTGEVIETVPTTLDLAFVE